MSPQELSVLDRRAFKITADGLREGPTPEAVLDVLRKLASLTGVPDDWPCGRCAAKAALLPIASEVVGIWGAVRGMADTERQGLDLDGEGCPFESSSGCLLGSRRPLQCRPLNPQQGAIVDAVENGHQVGLAFLGLAHYRIHLAPALGNILDGAQDAHPAWLEAFARGFHVFRRHAGIPVRPDEALEIAKRLQGRREPTGFPDRDPVMLKAVPDISLTPLETVLDRMPRNTENQRLFRVRVPFAYDTEEEVDEWGARYLRELDEFIAEGYDPSNLMDALADHDTFTVAYQGRNARDLLEPYGTKLIGPAARAALPDLSQPIDRRREGRIRVGYIGRNLRSHNGGAWAAGWIRNHGEDIETVALPLHTTLDKVTAGLRDTCHEFYLLPGDMAYSARFIKSLNLDVLIYTDIGMDGLNTAYAALRLAPVQCTAWGHPVTSGLPTVDYYLSSELMEPAGAEAHYTEQLVRLPGSGLFYTPRRVEEPTRSKADFGLDEGPLFLMPNNPLKMVPRWDALFAQVSDSTGRPIVFLEGYQPVAAELLKRRFKRNGVRAIWLPKLSAEEYQRLLALADLVLDPPAWGGGNTTLEAFRYRKPVLTMPGEFMRGRHGLAFLTQAGMPSLIAETPEDYVRVASDPGIWEAAVKGANWEGPFEDPRVVPALDEWIRRVARA